MIPTSLTTKRITLEDGSTAYPFPWNGEVIAVRDNAANILDIVMLFANEEMEVENKATQVIEKMFVDPDDAFCACDFDYTEFERLIEAVTWDICGVNLGSRTTDTPLWDIEEDAAAIRTSLLMAYGIQWDDVCQRISWSEFVALIAGLPQSTPLGCAMYYRDERNRPRSTKYNKEQVAEFNRLHLIYKLGKKNAKGSHDRVNASSKAMDDLALAFARKAR